MKNKDNELLYLEHYPHWCAGTSNSTTKINVEFLTLLSIVDDDLRSECTDLVDGTNYAMFDLFGEYGYKLEDILKSLKRNGFWVGEWEEGSFAICLPDFKSEAITAIALQEAQINAKDFDF
jgi:hypothetical protein